MAEGRPLIAVTGPSRGGCVPRLLVGLALWMHGARPVQLCPARERTSRLYQGVVITGGADVDPSLYVEQPLATTNSDPARDAFESRLIDDALRRGLPLLGICRGAQLLNVCLGGSLHQNLDRLRCWTSSRRTLLPNKVTFIEAGSRLFRLTRRTTLYVNSLHSQGINRLGRGLVINARDRDGIVQGIEADGAFVIGVQWHPEYLLHSRRQRRLFAGLVDAARYFIR